MGRAGVEATAWTASEEQMIIDLRFFQLVPLIILALFVIEFQIWPGRWWGVVWLSLVISRFLKLAGKSGRRYG